MTLKKMLSLNDNLNANVKVNDNELNCLYFGSALTLYESNLPLLKAEVMSYGYYDGVFTYRVKGGET